MICAAHKYIRMTKSIKMRWAGHVARMGDGRGAYRVLVGRPEGKMDDRGVDWSIILKLIFRK
jgi:hypothetical protein